MRTARERKGLPDMANFVEKTGKTVEEAIEAALFALHLPKDRCTVEILEEPSNGFLGLIGKRDAKVRVTAKEEPLPPQQEKSLPQREEAKVEEAPAAPAEEVHKEEKNEEAVSMPSAPVDSREGVKSSGEEIVDRGFSYTPPRESRSFSEMRRERFSSGKRSYAADAASGYSRPERVRKPLSPADAEAAIKKAEGFLQQIFQAMELDVAMERRERPNAVELNLSGHNLGILIGKHGQTLDALQYLVNLAANQGLTEERIRIILDIEDYRERREETLYRLAARLAERCCRTNQRVVLEPMNRHERKIIHLALQENHRVLTYSAGDEPFRKVVIEPKRRVSRMDGNMSEEDY